MKMEKTPRYTQRERNMVLAFAAQYKDVIENKRTDAESNRKKDEVWRQISREFNLRVYHQRSAKQLRQLYKNMKLLLKKDLCGEGKGNRSFMDLLNTLSQPDSMNQCISGQMSPGGYSNSQQQKFDDDYDDSKMPSVGFDSDVILIKSEDISDTEQSQPGGTADDLMDDDDDDDCLSPKDIPEVCLEEEDDEIFATDLRQTPIQHERQSGSQMQTRSSTQNHQPEISIQSVGGGIRVGSIGSLANMKTQHGSNGNSNNNNSGGAHNSGHTLLNNSAGSASSNNNNSNSALNISHASNTSGASNLLANGASPLAILRQSSDEQARQALLLNGLGLSAVHPPQDSTSGGQTALPSLQRGGSSQNASLNVNGSGGNSYLHLNGHKTSSSSSLLGNFRSLLGEGHTNGNSSHSGNSGNRNDYLMTLAIEERKRKIDLLDAQIKYWQTLTKKLDANPSHQPMPACACHFPGGKVNGLQTPTSSS